MRTHILLMFLFSLLAVAAAWPRPAQRSNGSIGSDDKQAIFDLGTIARAEQLDSRLGVDVVAALNVPLSARTGIWTGIISDSSCGASHDAMTEHGRKATDKQCTQMCVMNGAKYVFVSDGRVLMVKNQNFADLKAFAGDRVMVSGDLTGDTITMITIVTAR